MLQVAFIPKIDRVVRRVVSKGLRWYANNFPVPHNVKVLIVPAPVVIGPDGMSGFGVFCTRPVTVNDRRVRPGILIAGQCPPTGITYDDWLQTIPETLFHELAHYEQFRDGRKLQERGVAVRALNLAKRCYGTEPA